MHKVCIKNCKIQLCPGANFDLQKFNAVTVQVVYAVNMVAMVVEELAESGIPMPEKITYLDPIGKFFHTRR